jgi:WSC domain
MTIELCTAACLAAGFTLAGVEYAGECYCDTAISNGGGPAPDGNALCDMACNGNAAETCGGPNRLNVYSYTGSGSGSTTSVSGTGTSTSQPTSTTSIGSGVTGLPTGWTYKGCWLDQQHGRILSFSEGDIATLTVESCVAACKGLGYSVAGMEYYTQCYCGNAIIGQGVLASPQSGCNTPCGGNSAETCGGPDRMSIYSNQTNLYVQPLAVVQNTSLPGNWEYQGCLM